MSIEQGENTRKQGENIDSSEVPSLATLVEQTRERFLSQETFKWRKPVLNGESDQEIESPYLIYEAALDTVHELRLPFMDIARSLVTQTTLTPLQINHETGSFEQLEGFESWEELFEEIARGILHAETKLKYPDLEQEEDSRLYKSDSD